MTNKKLKVAQIGVGGFGAARRARMRESGLFDLVTCYDRDPQAMAQCRNEDGARPVRTYEELLATPDIEAVIISTGAKFHAEQAIAAAEHGLHVFVEKPLCSTREEMTALLEVRRRTGVLIGMGHVDHSCDQTSIAIKRLIESGELGTPVAFEKTTAHSGGLVMEPDDWRADPETNPGGMLFQCGVHDIHELIFYFGQVKRVCSMMRYDVHTTGTADAALCQLEFESGLMGTLNAYHVTPYRHSLCIFGTHTNIYREDRCFDEGTLLWTQTTHLDGQHEPVIPLEAGKEHDPYGNLRSFHQAIRENGEPYPSLVDGARAVAVIFAAEESAQTGKMIELPSIG